MAVSARTNAQTSRKGWRPRKTSDKRLAQDIAASITAHRDAGTIKTASEYTTRQEIIAMVNAILEAK